VKSLYHSGGLGDIIYSLPTVKALGGGVLYLPEYSKYPPYPKCYDNLKRLLLKQPYITAVKRYINQPIDYNLDLFRQQPLAGRRHLIKRHLDAFECCVDNWQDPWLNMPESKFNGSIVHITPRWRDNSKVNWHKIIDEIEGNVYCIGMVEEFKAINHKKLQYLQTNNLFYLAEAISGAKAVYCNQNVSLAIAQGLGKTYFLEQKPGKTNCLLYTDNENIL